MISRLLISADFDSQKEEALNILSDLKITQNHPDLFWLEAEGKSLGVEETKKIREHLSFKPHSAEGKVVVIIGADKLTPDAQNSLLKTLEEPPESATLILTAQSEDNLLPTILSRCQIMHIDQSNIVTLSEAKGIYSSATPTHPSAGGQNDTNRTIKEILDASLVEIFQIIEKTDKKEELLEALAEYIHQQLPKNPDLVEFASLVLQAQELHKAQGNIRAILEYLMLNLP